MNVRFLLAVLCLVPSLATAETHTQLVVTNTITPSPEDKTISVEVTTVTPTPLKTDLKEGTKIAAKYAGIYAGVGAIIGATVGTVLGAVTCAQLAKQSRVAGSTISTSDVFKVTACGGIGGGIVGALGYGLGYLPYGVAIALASRIEEKNKLTTKDIAKPIAIGIGASILARILTLNGSAQLPLSVSACVTLGCIVYKRMHGKEDDLEEQKKSLEKTLALLKAQQKTVAA